MESTSFCVLAAFRVALIAFLDRIFREHVRITPKGVSYPQKLPPRMLRCPRTTSDVVGHISREKRRVKSLDRTGSDGIGKRTGAGCRNRTCDPLITKFKKKTSRNRRVCASHSGPLIDLQRYAPDCTKSPIFTGFSATSDRAQNEHSRHLDPSPL